LKKDQSRKGKKSKKGGEISRYRWATQVFLIAIVLSAALSLASETTLAGAGTAVAVLILVVFIGLGIVFDIIGVAVTAADATPFHSMAAHREKGAAEALGLLRNASHVSSICNDVVGDICGIVSGTTAAVIVVRLQAALDVKGVLLSVGVTALISGLTIGGKALGKNFAISKCTRVVYWAGRFLHLFHR
jgi:CBS domain containing-hemolysin-like protein